MARTRFCLCASALFALQTPAFCQDSQDSQDDVEPEAALEPADEAVPQIDLAPLENALAAQREGRGTVVTGEVLRDEAGSGGFGAVVVVASDSPRRSSVEFDGKLEAHIRGGGGLVVVSAQTFPGFGIFVGDQIVVRTDYRDTPLSVETLSPEVRGILDPGRLARLLGEVEWTVEADADAGTTTYRGSFPASLLPDSGDAAPMGFDMMPKVMRIDAALVLDGEGWITSSTFGVVRSDPMARVQRHLQYARETEGTSAEVPFNPTAANGDELEEGAVARYQFEYTRGDLTPRLGKFTAAAVALMLGEEF